MWPIEVTKMVNNPKRYAKTKRQKKMVQEFRKHTGFSIIVDKKTGIKKGDTLQ